MEAFEEQTMMDLYKGRFGDEGVEKFKRAADKVKTEQMTFRQAAATLGITYYEFVSLLDEARLVTQNTDLLKKCKDAISIKEMKGV